MRVGKGPLYAVFAVAFAVAYGFGAGPYWLTDMVVFAVMAIAVAYFCFVKGAKTTGVEQAYQTLGNQTQVGKLAGRPVKRDAVVAELGQREHAPRSRIAHYVTVSRIKSRASTAWLRRESDSPFERALLGESGWQRLSEEGLEEIVRRVPDASANSAQ